MKNTTKPQIYSIFCVAVLTARTKRILKVGLRVGAARQGGSVMYEGGRNSDTAMQQSKEEKTNAKNRIQPSAALRSKLAPTTETANAGLIPAQAHSTTSASRFEIRFLLKRAASALPPAVKPPSNPMRNAIPPSAVRQRRTWQNGAKSTRAEVSYPPCTKISESTKNGNKAGIMLWAQRRSPSEIPAAAAVGRSNRRTANKKIKTGAKNCFTAELRIILITTK
ncbi:MAG: hypothetical protein RR075_06300 [Pygmaiobacter sp.]